LLNPSLGVRSPVLNRPLVNRRQQSLPIGLSAGHVSHAATSLRPCRTARCGSAPPVLPARTAPLRGVHQRRGTADEELKASIASREMSSEQLRPHEASFTGPLRGRSAIIDAKASEPSITRAGVATVSGLNVTVAQSSRHCAERTAWMSRKASPTRRTSRASRAYRDAS